jgi:REP element-mobilizing transposase RayT
MPQSLARIVLHIIFSTKHREPFFKDPDVRARLHAYLAVVLQEVDCEPILINGTEDHVHILCNFSRTITVADLLETVKTAPSKWMKQQGPQYDQFFWQRGYGVFSISESDVAGTRRYVADQEEHHRHVSFQEEFRELCRQHGIEIDERYVWD